MYFMRLNIHAKDPLHCPTLFKDILEFMFWFPQTYLVTSSVPDLHNRENLNVSGREEDIKKRKTPFFFVLEVLLNKLLFNSLFFFFLLGTFSSLIVDVLHYFENEIIISLTWGQNSYSGIFQNIFLFRNRVNRTHPKRTSQTLLLTFNIDIQNYLPLFLSIADQSDCCLKLHLWSKRNSCDAIFFVNWSLE